MGRRFLALPLSLLLAVALLLAALTFAGGIPLSIAVPLISGVTAAMLTGGLALMGIWMNMRYQIERDRIERLRHAYAQLLRSGDKIIEAFHEVIAFPDGRSFPEPAKFVISSYPMGGPPSQLDIERAKYDPWHTEKALVTLALDLHAEAEATIYLEEGAQSAVLAAWTALGNAFDKWRGSINNAAIPPEVRGELRDDIPAALAHMRLAAHIELKRLAARR